MSWRTRIDVTTRKGVSLKTLADLRAYMLSLPTARQHDRHWQHAAKLALEAAETGDVEPLRRQLMLAFLLSGDLVEE